MRGKSWKTEVASSIPVDDTNLTYAPVSTVQEALEAQSTQVNTSASPGFSFGRNSNVNSGTWLQCESVPSNKSGRWVYITDAVVKRVFVSNENVTTFDISAYYHDGDEVNLTLLGTVTVTAARGNSFDVNWPVPTDKQIALQLTSGSARNMVAGLELTGSNT